MEWTESYMRWEWIMPNLWVHKLSKSPLHPKFIPLTLQWVERVEKWWKKVIENDFISILQQLQPWDITISTISWAKWDIFMQLSRLLFSSCCSFAARSNAKNGSLSDCEFPSDDIKPSLKASFFMSFAICMLLLRFDKANVGEFSCWMLHCTAQYQRNSDVAW